MRTFDAIRSVGDWFVEACFPIRCIGCNREDDAWICDVCMGTLHEAPQCFACHRPSYDGRFCSSCKHEWPFVGLTSLGAYTNPVLREAVHTMKYDGVRALGDLLGQQLASVVRQTHEMYDIDTLVIPTPLTQRKERQRGFNQAEVIAHAFGISLAISVNTTCLRRVRSTISQTQLDNHERWENVRGAFSVSSETMITKKRIFLVDDVVTTGATVSACAEALRAAGAGEIHCVAVAHGASIDAR